MDIVMKRLTKNVMKKFTVLMPLTAVFFTSVVLGSYQEESDGFFDSKEKCTTRIPRKRGRDVVISHERETPSIVKKRKEKANESKARGYKGKRTSGQCSAALSGERKQRIGLAQYNLAMDLLKEDPEANKGEIKALFQQSAARGLKEAQYNLAITLLKEDPEANKGEIKALLQQSAAQGLKQAQYDLARILCEEDAEINKGAIKELLEKSAAQGYVRAKKVLEKSTEEK